MSDETWASKRLDKLTNLRYGPSQQGKGRLIEWDATAPPPDAEGWKGVAVVSEPRRGGKSYWRKRAEDAEGRLVCAGCRQAEDRAEIAAIRSLDLTQAQQAVERADLAASEARAERDRLVRQARVEGRTIYAIAAEMGVTQNAVRRMLGLR